MTHTRLKLLEHKGRTDGNLSGGEATFLHQVTTGNGGRIRLWTSALREHLVLPIGARPEEKNLKRGEGMKSCQSKKKESEVLSLRRRRPGVETIAGFKCETAVI